MSEIQFMEKPDWVSWDSVRDCLNKSHQTNKKHGFEMLNSSISTEELIKKNKGAHCFIALYDNEVIGVSSVRIEEKHSWWVHGLVAYYFCDGILPKYRGTDVYFGLLKMKEDFVGKSGARTHQFNTSEFNKTVIRINIKGGFKLHSFFATDKGADYYSVSMVKWDDGCPYPDWFMKLMFNMSKIVTKILWKPGYKRRFWFN